MIKNIFLLLYLVNKKKTYFFATFKAEKRAKKVEIKTWETILVITKTGYERKTVFLKPLYLSFFYFKIFKTLRILDFERKNFKIRTFLR